MMTTREGETTMTARNAARTIAVLLLLQMIAGPIVNFRLLLPVIGQSVFLQEAAPHATQIGVAVVLGLVMVGISVGIAIVAWPIFRRHSRAMAFWLLALAIVNLGVGAVEYINTLSMLSYSKLFANADASQRDMLQAFAGAVAAPRIWAHFVGLMIAGSVAFVLYAILFRFALVPRVLAGLGALAALSEIVAVGMPLFGQPVVFPMIAPLGLAHIALVLWLLVKGFAEHEPA